MLYNTGTISINGNTATGSGTNWTAPASQVRAGQTIIVMSNPVQLFQISSVNSATSMTVTPAASPALSGQKYGILVSDIISVDGLAQAMSQLIKEYDENIGAWETFASTSANQLVTVTINGTSLSIPAIGGLARKGANSDITELKGLTTALSIAQGGTGAKTAADARTNLGLGDRTAVTFGNISGVTQSEDVVAIGSTFSSYLNSATTNRMYMRLYPEFRPDNTGYITLHYSEGSNNKYWGFRSDGDAIAPRAWVNPSDERIKTNIKRIENPLTLMKEIKGCTWSRLDLIGNGIGFIAQDVQKIFPEAVSIIGKRELLDGTIINDTLALDTGSVAAALHHEAILALMDIIDQLSNEVEKLKS